MKEYNTDMVVPSGKWVFDENVTACFPDMLKRSIPGYEQMRECVYMIGSKFIRVPFTHITDLGCSDGQGLVPFVEHFGSALFVNAVDNSQPMVDACKARFSELVKTGHISVHCHDFVDNYPYGTADLTLCILTLQFTPIEERQQILRNVYEHTTKGGALILVEKIQGDNANLDDMLTHYYYDTKRANGYTEEQIMTKRKSLRGVLVPLKAEFNENLLHNAGFTSVQRFWQHLNFAGWVAIRE